MFVEVMNFIKSGGQGLAPPMLKGMSISESLQAYLVPYEIGQKAAFQCVVSDEFLNHFP